MTVRTDLPQGVREMQPDEMRNVVGGSGRPGFIFSTFSGPSGSGEQGTWTPPGLLVAAEVANGVPFRLGDPPTQNGGGGEGGWPAF